MQQLTKCFGPAACKIHHISAVYRVYSGKSINHISLGSALRVLHVKSVEMFGTRRLAKRSIIGTRVCAPWTDGRFYPGIIQSTQTWPNGEQAYTVYFDDGFARTFMDKDLVGPGFQNTSYLTLKFGQKVFLTHNSREFTGVVDKHDVDNDEITITITGLGLEEGASSQVVKKLDDVRLIESRKSARLQDCDTDYSRLADMHRSSQDPNKKRTVSHVIDVPTPIPKQR